MKPDGQISLEQLYKMLHISKRKAAWMLQNGIIPCETRNTKTHRYVINIADVEAYLQKSSYERRKEIPVGIFNAKPTKQTVRLNRAPLDPAALAECYITIADDCKEKFIAHVEKRLKYFNDALTVDEAAKIIGYTRGMVLSHVQEKSILAVIINGKYIVSKKSLAEFFATNKAFAIVNKSRWHLNTILQFSKKAHK